MEYVSYPLTDERKTSLHTYVFHLREAIKQSNLPDWKKERLGKRLDEFEEEIERGRVRIVVIASVLMAVIAAPGEIVGSYDAVVRITNSIMRLIGEAKAADDEQRQITAGCEMHETCKFRSSIFWEWHQGCIRLCCRPSSLTGIRLR